MTVPFCTGVPADSMTTAVMSVLPESGSTPTDDTRRIVVLVGAKRGTLSQAEAARAATRRPRNADREMSDMWRAANDNSYVQLRGQGTAGLQGGSEQGYAMAALLVGLSVMAILMGAAMPVWSKQAQREREEEYLFRAREYARGVMKWQHKYGASFPPSLDVLVEQRFVRRKYKDPLSGQDFNPVFQTAGPIGQPGVGSAGGSATPGQIPQGQTQSVGGFGNGAATGGGFGSGTNTASGFGAGGGFGGGTATMGQTGGTSSQSPTGQPGAPVIGVVSKSKATGIKVYNGRTRYDQWAVTYQDIKPGKGLPPDILQAMNAAGAAGQQPNGFGGAQGGAGNPFGAGAKPGQAPFGQPGANPFGGAQPMGPGGANPFGQPGTNPFGAGQKPGAPGASPFQPAYPPPATGSGQAIFGQPQKKQ
ncbi:MAG: hypothetical protein U0P30_07455 [Vicinamibacterales bacterium]